MLADLLINTATVTRKVWENARGQRTATVTTAVLLASVQPMRAARVEQHGLTASETGYTAYFDVDPQVNTLDTITWGDKVLSVLGPARDEAGRGRVWAVDCKA